VLLPLETDRLTLRRFALDDVPGVLRLSADPTVHEVADELGSDEPEARAYVEQQLALDEFEPGALFDLAIERPEGGELIGMATVVRTEPTVEIGYALHTDFRGRGYATEAATALLALAMAEFGASEVRAQVAPANGPSRAVLERVGLREVGDRFAVREAGDLAYAITSEEWEHRQS
jgi:RimJ/RimL family protein N-acetyltransferase